MEKPEVAEGILRGIIFHIIRAQKDGSMQVKDGAAILDSGILMAKKIGYTNEQIHAIIDPIMKAFERAWRRLEKKKKEKREMGTDETIVE